MARKDPDYLYGVTAARDGDEIAAVARASLRAVNAPTNDDVVWSVAVAHARAFIAGLQPMHVKQKASAE